MRPLSELSATPPALLFQLYATVPQLHVVSWPQRLLKYVGHRRLTDGDSIYRAVETSSVLEGLFGGVAILDSPILP